MGSDPLFKAPPSLAEITPGIYQLKIPLDGNPLGYILVYLIWGKEGWTVVDTGWDTPASLATWEAGLKELGCLWEDIRQVIATHSHVDHCSLACQIKKFSGAKFFMAAVPHPCFQPEDFYQRMNRWMSASGIPPAKFTEMEKIPIPDPRKLVPPEPDVTLREGEEIPAGTLELMVISTPGHDENHVCLYAPQERLLFTGDHVLPTITPNISVSLEIKNSLGKYFSSLRKIAELDVALALPGHEYAFSNLKERIAELLRHHKERLREVHASVSQTKKTPYEIAQEVTWSIGSWQELSEFDRRLAVAEVFAHLEFLETKGYVERSLGGGLLSYQAKASLPSSFPS